MINSLAINSEKESKRIINFLKKTFSEQKTNKVVIGLSGGLDSMTVFYLLLQALPPKNIFAYHLPYEKESPWIKKIIKETNFPKENYQMIPIKNAVHQIKELTINDLTINNIRLGNIMSRTRMIVLFDQAKKLGGLVCGTENKSERLLGYFTRFGDAASDIEPIQHLYKTQVIKLAKYLKVPEEIINQSPTAGLWQGQTDEDEFGFTYKEADQILHLYFDKKLTSNEIKQRGLKNAAKIINRVKNNRFKFRTPYFIQ